MSYKFTNKAIAFLDAPFGSTETTLLLPSGTGDLFPSISGDEMFAVVLEDRIDGQFEICYCTARTGDQLTVTRGEEGTIGISWPADSNISLRTNAAFLNEVGTHEERITTNEADIAQLQADLDPLKIAIFEAIYPVGSLYISTLSTNPATSMGFGTWAAHAEGRALVGVGNNGQATWAAAESRGNETHTLTTAQMPSHTHNVDPPSTTTSSNGSHSHTSSIGRVQKGGDSSNVLAGPNDYAPVGNVSIPTNSAGSHTHTLNIAQFASKSAGSGSAHNNVQPSLAIYVWKRTA